MARHLALAALSAALLLMPDASSADFCPAGSPQAGGMSDIMLIYMRADGWKAEDFRPYVARLDKRAGGRPTDWFYDAFLFMAYGGAPSGKLYYNGATDRADWEFFIDWCFAEGRALNALNATVASLEQELGGRATRIPIILMIPYPSPAQRDFGDVDGDGASEDLSQSDARLKVIRWEVDRIESRWRTAGLDKLSLWGYYWMNEAIRGDDVALVQQTAAYVHGLERGFTWIPWFNAPGAADWRRLGFDFAVLQPNYAFMGSHTGYRDESRLSQAANLARKWGMGVEIELDGRATRSEDSLLNLLEYLRHGAPDMDGYGRAVRAYYQGYHSIAELYASDRAACNAAYDALFDFTRGRYRDVGRSIIAGRQCLADGKPTDLLTDGRWATRANIPPAAVPWSEGERHEVLIELHGEPTVAEVRVHIAPSPPERSSDFLPERVRLRVSSAPANADAVERDEDWQAPGARWQPPGPRADGLVGGFGRLTFAPRRVRRLAITIAQPAESLRIDEVQVLRAPSLLANAICTADPPPSDGALDLLLDGDYETGVVWGRGPVTVRMDLGEERVFGELACHGGTKNMKVVSLAAARDGALDTVSMPITSVRRGGVLNVSLPPAPLRRLELRIEAPRGGRVRLNEIEGVSARNLALGAAYTYEPPYQSEYPDSGGELTDGRLSSGFGDGGTVGFYSTPCEVTLDLGDAHPLDAVRLHCQGGGYAAVHFPSLVTVSTSLDGVSWTSVGRVRGPAEDAAADEAVMAFLEAKLASENARYVRVTCSPRGWTMLSEVEVMSAGRNVALHEPYALKPCPYSEEKYADNAALLTDGLYTETNYAQGRAAGWFGTARRITLDLGQPRTIARVNAHLQGGGPAAVWFPDELTVTTSEDDADWQPAGKTTEHPPETGEEDVRGYMTVTFRPRSARYIRLDFPKGRGWVMLDEVEACGPE